MASGQRAWGPAAVPHAGMRGAKNVLVLYKYSTCITIYTNSLRQEGKQGFPTITNLAERALLVNSATQESFMS